MRRFLLALLMTTVVASLQAITINWQVANSEYAWADEGVTTFLVYSQSDSLSAEDVYKGNYGNYTGYRVNQQVGTTTVGGVEVNSYMTLGFGSNETSTVGSKAYVAVDLEGQAFGSGYFYLVVFKTGTNDGTNDQYAVSRAVQYTAGTNADADAANGIYDITVDDKLTMGDYIEIPWLGGNWRDAVVPEPTALALLALGVAGLALRRKI